MTDWKAVFQMIDPKLEAIVEEHLGTAPGRGKLMASMFGPAQIALDFCQSTFASGRMNSVMARGHVTRWLSRLEYMQSVLTGEESFDRVRYGSLMSDIRVFLAELPPVKAASHG